MNTLHLTLHAYWFNEILQGRKKNEYRDITPFWRSRLFHRDGTPKPFDAIRFKNGYATDAPFMVVEFKVLTESDCFDIALGEIIEMANIEKLKVKPPHGSFHNPATKEYKPGDLFCNYEQVSISSEKSL